MRLSICDSSIDVLTLCVIVRLARNRMLQDRAAVVVIEVKLDKGMTGELINIDLDAQAWTSWNINSSVHNPVGGGSDLALPRSIIGRKHFLQEQVWHRRHRVKGCRCPNRPRGIVWRDRHIKCLGKVRSLEQSPYPAYMDYIGLKDADFAF